jgi:hypothetical protein
MRACLGSLEFRNAPQLFHTQQFVSSRIARGLPGAGWINSITAYYGVGNPHNLGSRQDWCEDLICLVVVAINLQELTVDVWKMPVLVVVGQLRAATMRVLEIECNNEFFASAPFINQLIHLDRLKVTVSHVERTGQPDLKVHTVLCLPRLRELAIAVRGDGSMGGLYAFLFISHLEDLQRIIIRNSANEIAVEDIGALVGKCGLRSVQLDLAPAHYARVFSRITAECVHLDSGPITPAFVGLLRPTVQSLLLHADGEPGASGLWAVLDRLLCTPTHHVRSVSVLTFQTKVALPTGHMRTSRVFRWASSRAQPDEIEMIFRGRLQLYARDMANKGIRLCDSAGITLQEHLRVVSHAFYSSGSASQAHMVNSEGAALNDGACTSRSSS